MIAIIVSLQCSLILSSHLHLELVAHLLYYTAMLPFITTHFSSANILFSPLHADSSQMMQSKLCFQFTSDVFEMLQCIRIAFLSHHPFYSLSLQWKVYPLSLLSDTLIALHVRESSGSLLLSFASSEAPSVWTIVCKSGFPVEQRERKQNSLSGCLLSASRPVIAHSLSLHRPSCWILPLTSQRILRVKHIYKNFRFLYFILHHPLFFKPMCLEGKLLKKLIRMETYCWIYKAISGNYIIVFCPYIWLKTDLLGMYCYKCVYFLMSVAL